MGCLCSVEKPPGEPVLAPNIVIGSDSDSGIKNQPSPDKKNDIIPLLERPEPLNFASLQFTSDSSSVDIDTVSYTHLTLPTN